MSLTLLVPCFNEGAGVDVCLEALTAWRSQSGFAGAFEIVCVDDGSTDDTATRLAAWARRDGAVRVVRTGANLGKGGALRAGIDAARNAYVIFLDADLAVGPDHIERVVRRLDDGADVAIGCRHVPGAEVVRAQRATRRFMGRVYLAAARTLLGLRVPDVTCGFKGFRRDVARRLFGASRARRWGIDAEVLYLAQRSGCRIDPFPVRWFDGSTSAVRLGRDVWGAWRELWGCRWRGWFARAAQVSPVETAEERVPTGSFGD